MTGRSQLVFAQLVFAQLVVSVGDGLVVVRALCREGRKGPYRQEVSLLIGFAIAIAIAQVSVIAAARQIQYALLLQHRYIAILMCAPFSDQTEALMALRVS